MKKLSELRKTAPISEPPRQTGFERNSDGTRNYWDEESHAAVPCWSRTSDDKASYRIRHICKLCKRHDMTDGCYRLIDGMHAWVCDECYAARSEMLTGRTFLDTAEGAIPLVLKPRFERKADGHLGGVGGE